MTGLYDLSKLLSVDIFEIFQIPEKLSLKVSFSMRFTGNITCVEITGPLARESNATLISGSEQIVSG